MTVLTSPYYPCVTQDTYYLIFINKQDCLQRLGNERAAGVVEVWCNSLGDYFKCIFSPRCPVLVTMLPGGEQRGEASLCPGTRALPGLGQPDMQATLDNVLRY